MKRMILLLLAISILVCNNAAAAEEPRCEEYQYGSEIEEGVFVFGKVLQVADDEAIAITKLLIPSSDDYANELRSAISNSKASGGTKGSDTVTITENDPTGSFSATLTTTYYTTTVIGYACAKLSNASITINGYGSSGNYMGSGIYLVDQSLTAGTTGIHPTLGIQQQVGYSSKSGSVRTWGYSAPNTWCVVKSVSDAYTAIGATLTLRYRRGTAGVIKSFTFSSNLIG